MTAVVWKEFRVRVRVMAPSYNEVDSCLKEIHDDIRQAVNKKVLSRRHHADILPGPVRQEAIEAGTVFDG